MRVAIAGTPTILAWMVFVASAAGQTSMEHRVADLLPRDARIIETAEIPLRDARTRMLVLWMKAPQRVISKWDSAADFLYGDHWLGPTLLSLVDPSIGRLINTVEIRPDPKLQNDPNTFPIPFFTYKDFYEVPHPDKEGKGTPRFLGLRDLTGEGVAGQFVLFNHVLSGIAAGSVFGYSAKSDRAVQYNVELNQNRFQPVARQWAESVFHRKPLRPGYWKFTWEAGHGEWEWIDEEVRFDAARQLFVERKTTRAYPGFAQVHCEVDRSALSKFTAAMRNLVSRGVDTEWLESTIGKTVPNRIDALGMVPTFHETQEMLNLVYQVGAGGAIGVDFTAESEFAAALRAGLRAWCDRL